MAQRIAIVGAGIVGAALAAELAARPNPPRVLLLEAAPQPGQGATSQATGGLRHQFGSEVHVRLSLLGVPVYRNLGGIGFRAHGYLFVTASAGRAAAQRIECRLQNRLGAPARTLTPAQAAALYPGLRTDDLAGASFCPADGSADPAAALRELLRRARGRGVELRCRTAVDGFVTAGARVAGVRCGGAAVDADAVVVAAGAGAATLLATLGLQIPVRPFRRQVFVLDPPPGLPGDLPLLVDADTGWYAHQDRSGRLLFGGTDRDTRPGADAPVDWGALPVVLAAAVHRVPAFAAARVERAYAGVRTLTPDDHALLGRAPGLPGLWLSVGWGGHGFMHAPGAARVLADLILKGETALLDPAPLSPGRFAAGQPSSEPTAF